MTLLQDHRVDGTEDLDLEVLFREARRRRRHRWLLSSGVLIGVIALGLVASLIGGFIGPQTNTTAGRGSSSHSRAVPQTSTDSANQVGLGAWGSGGALTTVTCSGSTCVSAGYTNEGEGLQVPRMLYSADAGSQWFAATIPNGIDRITGVACSDPINCVAVGTATGTPSSRAGVVLGTSNGGSTWTQAFLSTPPAAFTDVACPSTETCLATATPALQPLGDQPLPLTAPVPITPVMYESHDGGQRWNAVQTPPGVESLTQLSCMSGSTCMAIGPGTAASPQSTGEPWIIASQDGGSTWIQVRPPPVPLPSDQAVTTELLPASLTCFAANRCLVAGPIEGTKASAVFSTTDGGTTWVEATGVEENGPDSYQLLPDLVDCGGAGTCIGFTSVYDGEIGTQFSSTNNGLTWQRVGPSLDYANSASLPGGTVNDVWCADVSCVVAGGWTGYLSLARSNDAGAFWSSVTLPIALASLASVSCWSDRGCMAVGGTATGGGLSLITTNGGRSWENNSVPAGTPLLGDVSCFAHGVCTALATEQPAALNVRSSILRFKEAGRKWSTTSLPPNLILDGLSCWNSTACIGVGSASAATNTGASAFVTPEAVLPINVPKGSAALVGVSCLGPKHCVAVSAASIEDGKNVGASVFRLAEVHSHFEWLKEGHISSAFAVLPTGYSSGSQRLTCVGSGTCYLATEHWEKVAPPGRSSPPPQGVLLVSRDSGRSWNLSTRAPDGDESFIGVTCSSGVCLAVGQGLPSHGAAMVTASENSLAWHNQVLPGGVAELDSVTCVYRNRCLAVGTYLSSAGLLTSNDGGQTWSRSRVPAWTEGLGIVSR